MNEQFLNGYRFLKTRIPDFFRSKNAKSIVWSTLEAIVYPTLMLLATPYFIAKLGADQYGIWMLVNTVIMSIGILNIGLGDATIKFVAEYKAKNDFEGMKNVIKSTYSVYLILSLIVFVLSGVVCSLVARGYFFDLSDTQRSVASILIVIAGLTLAIKFLEQVFLGVFKGQGLYPLASKISIIGKIMVIALNVLMVFFSYSLIEIFLSTVVVAALMIFFEMFLIGKQIGFSVFIPAFERFYIKKIFSFGIWTWFLSVLGLLSTQVDKFIVISLADVKVFAFYSVGFMVFTQIHNTFSASTAWIFPLVTEKISNNEDVYMLYKKTQIKLMIAATILLTCFMLIEGSLLPLWLNADTYKSSRAFIQLFVCLNFVMASTILPYYFLNGSGHYRLNTYFNILTFISRIILIPIGFHYFGLSGLIYGLIISALLVVPVQIAVFHSKVLGDKNWLTALKFLIPDLLFAIGFLMENRVISILFALLTIIFIKDFLFSNRLRFREMENYALTKDSKMR